MIRAGLLLAALVPICGAAACGGEPSPGPPRLVPDVGGEIREWVLVLGDGFEELFLHSQAEIVARSSPGSRVVILYRSPATRFAFEGRLADLGFREPDRLDWRRTQCELPQWPRDLFVAGRMPEGAPAFYLHAPDHYERLAGRLAGGGGAARAEVEALAGEGAVRTGVDLEGGGVVAGPDRVFLTPEFVDRALAAGAFPDTASFLEHLRGLFGLDVLPLLARSALHAEHCDLYLAPAGSRRILLADPAQGAELLDGISREERGRFVARYRALTRALPEKDHFRALDPEVVPKLLYVESLGEPLAASLESVEAQLSELGFEIVKVPMLRLTRETVGAPLWLTYTNVVQEAVDGRSVVYLPTYRLPTLDRAARRIWEGLGYEVRPVDCLGPALMGGAVRCLTQVFR